MPGYSNYCSPILPTDACACRVADYAMTTNGAWFSEVHCVYDQAGRLVGAWYHDDEGGGCMGGVIPPETCQPQCSVDGGVSDAVTDAAMAQ
jgi:hypothetical protein